ncbi:MAG: beta-glucosidase [Alphaproteobacteria bacterium 64-11]|mgnify:CR=1 FL=1|nr:glycoside hydrolase family 3 C-terminal domain-containing protein [Alphaproteobacteria bacterium]OJU08851.1 MAG: beta-glucosidase [Alphaproteobacteria bacterium 64-11]
MRRILLASLVFGAGAWGAGALGAGVPAAEAQTPQPWFDPSLPVAARVDALVGQMTLEEKASQMVNQARAIPRLGVPAYNWWSEALHGVANNGLATVFPEPVGLAATFDDAAIHEMGVAISTEARVKFNQVGPATADHGIMQGLDFWSPNINIFRDPRWGRGQETYGEDPYLTGRMGSAFVRGMQGDDPKYFRVIATAKHYAVHSGPEPTRHEVDVKVSKHDEIDTYLPAFRALVTGAKVDSVMCAYNRINGQPACASDFLLTDQLRGKWGFGGYMVSDCDAIADIQRGHHYVGTYAEAAAVSLKHEVDSDCADFFIPVTDDSDYGRYRDAVKEGLVPESVLDASLKRLFTARMKLGLFDPSSMVPYAQVPESELMSPAHRALALKLAKESMVLLKNNGVLPLKPSVKHILVVGPLADQVPVLLGNYNGTPKDPVTALDGIRKAFPGAEVTYEPGINFLRLPEPVPASALSSDGAPGLKGEYYKGAGFEGEPAITRTDATVDFSPRGPRVLPEENAISVRWTGTLTAPDSGRYDIGLAGNNASLWIDGQLVVKADGDQRGPLTKEMRLEKGHAYSVKIEQTPARGPFLRFVWTKLIDDPTGRAVAAAKKADVVVAVAGITSALEGEEMTVNVPGFQGGDRTSLDMPQPEEDLLKAVKATGKPLVVVLMNGSALAVNWAAKNADAMLDAWYAGEEAGTAIGQTLSGQSNPSGHLPVTFYTGVNQLPPFDDYSMANRTYRYFTGKPLYPFGYGLSYTRFAYGKPKLTARALKAGDTLGVDVPVRNVGKTVGDAVAQLYLSFPKIPGTPIRALRGFTRVSLQPGEEKTVHFDLTPRQMMSVTEAGDPVVAAGSYTLSVGEGQPGTGAAASGASFKIAGSVTLPESAIRFRDKKKETSRCP